MATIFARIIQELLDAEKNYRIFMEIIKILMNV